ncbi:hypothetical protein GOV11_05055 [Candidatus Woesearchaeota archaeon]|nr:hypothetical protein [Candidatus Woesearchaeota archaeon]
MVRGKRNKDSVAQVWIIALVAVVAMASLVVFKLPTLSTVGQAPSSLTTRDSFTIQAGQREMFNGPAGSVPVEIISVLNDKVMISVGHERTIPLALGDGATAGDLVVSVKGIRGDFVDLDVSTQAVACPSDDEQTNLCRGASACCGGTCTLLPACAGKPNGLALSCGERELYCCSGKLSLKTC